MPGPAAKPAHLHVLAGNPSNKKLPQHKTASKAKKAKSPAPPRSLNGDSVAVYRWRKLTAELLEEYGTVPAAVLDLIEVYCATYSTWRKIHERIHATLKEFGGLTVRSKNGHPMELPDATQERKYAEQLKSYSAEISRQCARIAADTGEEEDELEKRMARRRQA